MFRHAPNLVTKHIRQAKQNYKNKLIEKLNQPNTCPKIWFKTAKQLTNKTQSQTIPTLYDHNHEATTDNEKVDLLNNYFSSQSTVDDRDHSPPPINRLTESSLRSITITPQDVQDALSLLDPSKASGPDMVSPRLLKEGMHELSTPLSTFFNKLLLNSYFPDSWKLANVAPIFKKSDPSKPSNYRPISLLSCIGKLMERCKQKYIYNYLKTNNLLTPFQSGFIKGDSTVNQLTCLYNDICQAMDEGKEVRAVFCDISKAFDRVWHRGLITKLSSFGICDSLLNWIISYLSNRKQRVVYANSTSSWRHIQAGVPQGSILGPLFFLAYINDIVSAVNSNIRLFADDTSLYIIVEDPITASTTLNNDLASIHSWSQSWLVSFNPEKNESIIFSRKRRKPQHPPLIMNSLNIEEVDTHKHLGLTQSSDAKWNAHISITLTKAWRLIGILRSLKFFLNRSCLEKMYFSLIRPTLKYSDVVWDNCSEYLKQELESVQVEAVRICTGATKYCNIQKLLNDLKWDTLSKRRKQHRLLLFYKMTHGFSPPYMSELIPHINRTQSDGYNLRHIRHARARTQAYSLSFLPKTIREWNQLHITIQNSPDIQSFKNAINKAKKKFLLIFNCGSRTGQILHTRLRLDCSGLNYDLYRRSLVNSPLCSRGSPETIEHFL